MFKNFFISFFAFAFVSVQTNAATHNSLKAAFDELNYSLSVEWDQKDLSFYQAKTEEFKTKIAGVSSAELIEFTLCQVKDKQLAAELSNAFTLIQLNKMNQVEARDLVMETISKSYNSGANWSGDTYWAIGAVLVFLVGFVSIFVGNTPYGGWEAPGCYEEYDCGITGDDCRYRTVCYTEP